MRRIEDAIAFRTFDTFRQGSFARLPACRSIHDQFEHPDSPGAPRAGRQCEPWLQFVPFILVLAIFYFIILLPMKKRQQKVQAFLAALKVNDRVITSGGIYGTITKAGDTSVQLQIANNVRIDARSIVGYQGRGRSVTLWPNRNQNS